MRLSRRRQYCINHWKGTSSSKPAPVLSNLPVDGQDPLAKRLLQLFEPLLKGVRAARIPRSQTLDSLTDLADHQNTQEQIVIANLLILCGDLRIASPAFAHFGNDVGIDQVHSRSTARPVSRERVIATPSRGAAASSALRLLPPLRSLRHSSTGTSTATALPWRVIVWGPSFSARATISLKRAFAS